MGKKKPSEDIPLGGDVVAEQENPQQSTNNESAGNVTCTYPNNWNTVDQQF